MYTTMRPCCLQVHGHIVQINARVPASYHMWRLWTLHASHVASQQKRLHRWPPPGRQWNRGEREEGGTGGVFTRGLMRRVEESRGRAPRQRDAKHPIILWGLVVPRSRRHRRRPNVTPSDRMWMNRRGSQRLMRDTETRHKGGFTVTVK